MHVNYFFMTTTFGTTASANNTILIYPNFRNLFRLAGKECEWLCSALKARPIVIHLIGTFECRREQKPAHIKLHKLLLWLLITYTVYQKYMSK
jgi:hypothetical protein